MLSSRATKVRNPSSSSHHEIAGPAHDVPSPAGGKQRIGAQHARGILGAVPVSQRHRGSAMNEDAGLAGPGPAPVGRDRKHLAFRDRLADRGRAAVDFLGRKEGRAEGLGQAIHEKDARVGQQLAQALYRGRRHGAAGVRDVAQPRQGRARQGRRGTRQERPDRRYAGKPGDAMPGQRTHELVADPELAKHERRPLLDRRSGAGSARSRS